jgi:hypothetical protein
LCKHAPRSRVAKVDCTAAVRQLLTPLCLTLPLRTACAPTERPSASVELTQSSIEERQVVGKAVLEDLARTLKQRVKLWVPAATNSSLDSLTLNVLTVETPLPGGGMSTKVSLVCFFAHDVSASDAKQTPVLDACKGEVEKALARMARDGA